jgi:hypothetical protein
MDLEQQKEDQDNSMETEDDCQQRYMRLHAIVQELKSFPFYRESSWYDEHYTLLQVYANHFIDGFAVIHPYIHDNVFRGKCLKLDGLMDKLMREYETSRWFDLHEYLIFNKTIIEVVDYIGEVDRETEQEVDVLCDMFKNL